MICLMKAKGKGPQLLLDFINRNEEEQQTVLNKSVHVVQESSNSFELGTLFILMANRFGNK